MLACTHIQGGSEPLNCTHRLILCSIHDRPMNASDVESRAVLYLEREVGWGGIQKAGIYGDVEGSLHTGLFLGS